MGMTDCIDTLSQKRMIISLNGNFMEGFITLNIINFADIARRENDGVS
jgi:hypothetical protein